MRTSHFTTANALQSATMDRIVAPTTLLLLLLLLAPTIVTSTDELAEDKSNKLKPTKWALLVVGSSGYQNYRHQADVCHAYQLLRRGGLKEENIVVMMYDDIAHNKANPRPGIVVNKPDGEDVYAGVPKDYTGSEVNASNMFAVLLGNQSAVQGGSGKVIDSKPHDRIFVFYTDHGGPGVLCMPEGGHVYANDFIEVLKKKHAMKSYKDMVIYVEACESGSIFEGLLPDNLNIYATTASSATQNSYAAYCPPLGDSSQIEYDTCLGDLYSVAWMEDSESHNLRKETVAKQYERVKERTSNDNSTEDVGSHVMEYGDKSIKATKLYRYQGYDRTNVNATNYYLQWTMQNGVVDQRDADLIFLWKRYEKADAGSQEKQQLLNEFTRIKSHRMHLDNSIESIEKLMFGFENGPSVLRAVRPPGHALVDDWDCLKSMVQVFESRCGSLTQYGVKHMRIFANLCNNGISREAFSKASAVTCASYNLANNEVPAQY